MKINKKIFPIFLAIAAFFICMVMTTTTAHADEVDDTPNFDEDFESYTIDGGGEQLGEKWTSSWFTKTGDFDEEGCSDKYFKVVADPKDETNKVLYVDTKTGNNSFFFITMKDIFVKNFELTYDYYVDPLDEGESPWFGITCRKPVDGRYNGVTNVQLLTRSWGPEGISVDFYRSVNDSHTPLKSTGENNTGAAPGFSNASENVDSINQKWLKVKISVIDEEFKIYINDKFIGMTYCDKKSALNYGFVSFVSCVNQTYIDNVHLENLDDEPYSSEPEPDTPTIQAPEMTNTEYTYTKGENLVVDVSLFGEAVTEIKQAATTLLTKYYTVEGDKVTISDEFLSTLSAGRKAFLITTAGGSKMFYVTISEDEPQNPPSTDPENTPPSTTNPTTPPSSTEPNDDKKGCKGSIVASIGGVAILSLGVLFIKRKKD